MTNPSSGRVLLLNRSALRDERHFPDPDRFAVTHQFDGQLAFGHGIHSCLGAALARVESRIILEETVAAIPSWDFVSMEMVHTVTVRGPANIVVRRT